LHAQITALTGVDTMALQLYDETTSEVAIPLLIQKGEATSVEPQAPGALTRHVLLTQRPLLLNGDLKKKAKGLGIVVAANGVGEPLAGQSFLGVPLVVGDRAIGVLALADDHHNTLTESHLAVLESVSTQIALAIENARLFARTRGELAREQDRVEQVRQTSHDLTLQLKATTDELVELRQQEAARQNDLSRLAFLTTMMHELAQPVVPEAALARAVELIGEALEADYGVIYVYDSLNGQLTKRAVYDRAALNLDAPTSLSINDTLLGAAYQSRAAINVADLAADARWQSQPLFAATTFQSAAAVPLRAGGEATGATAFFSNQAEAFAAGDLTFLESAAGFTALVTQHLLAAAALNTRQQEIAELELKLAEQRSRLDQELAARATGPQRVTSGRDEVIETTRVPIVVNAQTTEAGPALVSGDADSTVDAETTLVATRRRMPEALSEFEVTADELRHVPDEDEPAPLPGPGISPIAVIAVVGVLILAGAMLTFLAFGGWNRLFGGTPTGVAVIVTNTAAPTVAASPTVVVPATVAASPVPTDTVAPTATTVPTDTPAPTETPTETATPTETFTPGPTLPPGVVAYGIIQVAPGTSARLRASPNGDVVGSVPDDTQVQILQGREFNGGTNWIQIRLSTGQVGWIAENLVETITSP
jgi:GAF domain-containing protein